MVIGSGMIANRFINYKNEEDFIIFASGVSNSGNTVIENFEREFTLLQKTVQQHPDKTLVYFSTCSILDNDLSLSPYVIHKKKIEEYISQNINAYYIFRVSNLAGVSNNPYTLLNHFIFSILKEQPITVWKYAHRNIIGIDDMYLIANFFLKRKEAINTTINIANPGNYSVPFIIQTIENHLHKKAITSEIAKGKEYKIDVSIIESALSKLDIKFAEDYLLQVLKKYYHST